MLKHIRNFAILFIIAAIGFGWYLSRPDVAQVPLEEMSGPDIDLSDKSPREQSIPTVNIAEVDRWTEDEKPVAAEGLKVERYAEGFDHPRNIYVLPNGDMLVVETNSPPRDSAKGLFARAAAYFQDKAGAGVPSANRITLLRDNDQDGVPEMRSAFLEGLNSPFGVTLVGDTLYVANTDAVLAFPYVEGDTQITAKGKEVAKLNAIAPNNHWTRNVIASPDGTKLYIAVGSNSNIGENGLDTEERRAAILEHDIESGKTRIFASGLRNPVGMSWHGDGSLWTVVNERDMLGSDLVPDYLTKVELADDFGWPHHYWGGYTDLRVEPFKPEKRQYERRPDYALGAHTASLGVVFADGAKLGDKFSSGAFVARHGSWNREPKSGYDVVFVKFDGSKPVGKPINVLTGFLDKDDKAQGRPTSVAIAPDGALLVVDDVANIIWRVSAE